jgi:hypothetical protein
MAFRLPKFSLRTLTLTVILIAFSLGTARLVYDYQRYLRWKSEMELIEWFDRDFARCQQLQDFEERALHFSRLEWRVSQVDEFSIPEWDRLITEINEERIRLDDQKHALETDRLLRRLELQRWVSTLPQTPYTSCAEESKYQQFLHSVWGDN